MSRPLHLGLDASRAALSERTGTERYSYELIAALARIDRWHRYTLYTNGLPAALPALGPNFALCSLPLRRLWTHARLGPELARRPPDLLFVPAHVVPALHPPASVVTIHDLGYLEFPAAHPARRRLELDLSTRWSLRAARRVIAISGATRDALLSHYGADPQRIRVVHHGLNRDFHPVEDPALVAAVRKRHGLAAPYLLYVGTIQPRKNLERLIEAFARALAALGPACPLELVLGGRRGWLTERIERRADELGIANRVRFLGYLPEAELPALLSGAHAFVFPSLYEGFGMPILEAMACGAPVLASTSSALPEVAGEAALLVDPHNTDAIASGIVRLMSDENLRAELRARGRKRAANFSWERCARETLAVLEEATT